MLDGGSRDGSTAIIERYASHLAYWHSRKDGGQADAINHGFDRATGEIVAWLNSDDLYLPGAFQAVARAFRRGSPDIVYGDAWNFYEEDQTLSYRQGHWIRPEFLQVGGLLFPHAVFWRRTVHVPLWTELDCNIDGELWRRLVPGRKLQYVPLPLGVFRFHGVSKNSAESWREKWRRDDAAIWARHGRADPQPGVSSMVPAQPAGLQVVHVAQCAREARGAGRLPMARVQVARSCTLSPSGRAAIPIRMRVLRALRDPPRERRRASSTALRSSRPTSAVAPSCNHAIP